MRGSRASAENEARPPPRLMIIILEPRIGREAVNGHTPTARTSGEVGFELRQPIVGEGGRWY